ncbi:MAG: hypothetical protein K1060chlam1_00885 [Candidatus Anoxychlamydiales bacterium]|nr:hypothetical protein [Candidatus Anoxychlamydiales bacterium]
MQNKIKKNNFTLLEVMISLFLITIIITFLFGFFSKIMKLEKNIEEKKIKILAINHTQIRLTQVFSNVYQGDFINKSSFYTQNAKNSKRPILHISYDNKIDSNPNFSLVVRAKLYIDRNKNLCLKTFSRDQDQTPRKEILLKNVEKIEYNFLSNAHQNLKRSKLLEVSKNIYWYHSWPKKAGFLPSTIKIKINNHLDFAFFLPTIHVKL